jgi:uncharacterized membrane protein YgaE (UPF0421/DUF939 family)
LLIISLIPTQQTAFKPLINLLRLLSNRYGYWKTARKIHKRDRTRTPYRAAERRQNMARPEGPMTAQIENFIRMEARGEDHATVLKEIFGLNPGDAGVHAAECKMSRWRHREDAQVIWDDEIKERVRRNVTRAISRLEQQIDHSKPWVANKAANDYIALATKTSIFQDQERALNVKIEGMPDLGSPDQEE